jgi:putative salt-induced outer membrane protein YdiY
MRTLLVLLVLLLPSLAAADRVTVKGTVLEGTVKQISGGSIVMSTVYGKGDLTLKTEDVSAIETDAPFHVYKADDGTAVGRIVDISPDAVTIAPLDGGPQEIAFGDVQAAPRDYGEDASLVQRHRLERPWWSGNVDASFSATEGTTDTRAYHVGVGALRERGPSRLRLGASFIHTSNKDEFPDPGERTTRDVTASEIRGWIRQEYDLTERLFALGSYSVEHDGVEEVHVRHIGQVGAGYKLVDSETFYFAVDTGPSYVWESLYDGSLNNYVALAFGAETKLELPWNGASWFTRLDYMPSITDWTEDYRLRGETGLLVPIVDPVNFKLSLIDEYNSQPSEDAKANTLKTLLGLSVVY